jgi:hypothetical protein
MIKPKIICFVSKYNYAGKDHAARIVRNWTATDPEIYKFAEMVTEASSFFVDASYDHKDEPNALGITQREIIGIISKALAARHQDLPVYKIKNAILEDLEDGNDVLLTDIRRKEEFAWIREIHDVEIHTIEIVPTELQGTRLDSWVSPEIVSLWGRERHVINNDRTYDFDRAVVKLAERIYGYVADSES